MSTRDFIEKDYYAALGVPKDAEPAAIKKAYRTLARDHGDLTGAFKVVAERVLGLLDGLGVEAFGAAGDAFDPAMHEAVIHDTSPEVDVPTATTVLRQGFRRGDRVLRTAMVAVTDPESPAAAPPEAPDDVPPAG